MIIVKLLIIVLLLGAPPSVGAVEYADYMRENAAASGADELEEYMPEAAGDYLEENGISADDADSIVSIKPTDVFAEMWRMAKEKAGEPLRLFFALIAVVMISALSEGLGNTAKLSSVGSTFELISVLVCVGIVFEPVAQCFNQTAQALEDGSLFMLSFVPIFSGILGAAGNLTSAGSYNIIILLVAEGAVQVSRVLLMPMLSLCLALSIVDATNPAILLSGMLKAIKKLSVWGLSFIMTIFGGMLSIQSVVGNSADTLSVRAGKFLVSSLVPVVGGAVSDAYSTVRGSLGLLRGAVGSIGIIALAITVLPTIISLGLFRLAVGCGAVGADVFGAGSVKRLLENISTVLTVAFGIVICFSLMLIIATAIVMMAAL